LPGVVSVVAARSDQRSTTLKQVIGFAIVGTTTWRSVTCATGTGASCRVPKETKVPKENPLPKETQDALRGPRGPVWSRLCGQAKIGNAINAGTSTSPAGAIAFACVCDRRCTQFCEATGFAAVVGTTTWRSVTCATGTGASCRGRETSGSPRENSLCAWRRVASVRCEP
jgi:hypothetical protein